MDCAEADAPATLLLPARRPTRRARFSVPSLATAVTHALVALAPSGAYPIRQAPSAVARASSAWTNALTASSPALPDVRSKASRAASGLAAMTWRTGWPSSCSCFLPSLVTPVSHPRMVAEPSGATAIRTAPSAVCRDSIACTALPLGSSPALAELRSKSTRSCSGFEPGTSKSGLIAH